MLKIFSKNAGSINDLLISNDFSGLMDRLGSSYFDLKSFMQFIEEFRSETDEFNIYREVKKQILNDPHLDTIFGRSMNQIYEMLVKADKRTQVENDIKASIFLSF